MREPIADTLDNGQDAKTPDYTVFLTASTTPAGWYQARSVVSFRALCGATSSPPRAAVWEDEAFAASLRQLDDALKAYPQGATVLVIPRDHLLWEMFAKGWLATWEANGFTGRPKGLREPLSYLCRTIRECGLTVTGRAARGSSELAVLDGLSALATRTLREAQKQRRLA